ncbi:MAG: peptidoglycan DD-metalloendopeptidase family protein [Flavobacteriaceae bacterium]|nr:MAG: peptidoglycan DD-metalloendopeptidase family protein [Flavobacteriaceae bacterium]
MRVSMLRYRNFFLCRKTSQKKATGVHFFCIRYPYDALNRITGAASTGNSFTGRYDLSNVTYDKNGNILALTRGGHLDTNATSFGVMDDLRYFYDAGNKLTSVDDKAQNTQGFKDGNTSGDDYSYDVNGNMISDKNKGITNITYNHLNLPKTVSINANDYITYVYDAAGVKQAKYVIRNGGIGPGNITATKYAGNYIYENNVLQFFSTSEGYVKYNQSSQKFEYVYQMKDHLGNVRLSYTDTDASGDISQDEIIQENHYMPFGLKMRGFNNVVNSNGNSVAEKRMFGGKEYNEELGLNWYDITARNYDPALGRWMNVDPQSEKFYDQSPFNYALNNPVFFIDPDGEAPFWFGDPVKNPKIRSTKGSGRKGGMFGMTRKNIKGQKKFHNGVDILAPVGTPIQSIKGGTVYSKGTHKKLGNFVIIKTVLNNGSTLFTAYAHLDKPTSLKSGAKVKEGSIVGKAGKTGNAKDVSKSEEHVHIYTKVSTNGKYKTAKFVNPLQFFSTKFDSNGNPIIPKPTPLPEISPGTVQPVSPGNQLCAGCERKKREEQIRRYNNDPARLFDNDYIRPNKNEN